jgi:DNA-binding phage protein
MNKRNQHLGSSFEDWLEEEGLHEDATRHAVKSLLAWQVREFMRAQGVTKTAMARQMQTSRAGLDRLLDPDNESVTLKTMQSAARAIGARLELSLVFDKDAA